MITSRSVWRQNDLALDLSRCWVALGPAVLSGARIWPSVSRCLEISLGLRGPSPQAFTPLGGGWVNRPAPVAPLIREMPTRPGHFWEMPGACGLPTEKRPCATLRNSLVTYLTIKSNDRCISDSKQNKDFSSLTVRMSLQLVTVVKGDPKAPFSIATTPRCRGGRYSIPRLLHFTLDTYLIIMSVKQGGIKYHFLSFLYDSTRE